jgi:hypothetical protein
MFFLPADVVLDDVWHFDTAQWIDNERVPFTDASQIAQVRHLNVQVDEFCEETGVYAVADIVQALRYGALIQVCPDPLVRRIHAGWADYCIKIRSDRSLEEQRMHQLPPV